MAEGTMKYAKPPIQEAICELHFDLAQPFRKDQLEAFKSIWIGDYPDQKLVDEQNVQFQISPEGIKTDRQSLGYRLICRSADEAKSQLVQLSGSFLVINQVKPYPGWQESFRERILREIDRFQQTAGAQKIRRVGLRYIDKIDIPEQPVSWEKWFQFKLPIPVFGGSKVKNFQMHFVSDLGAQRRLTINAIGLPPTSPDFSSVILDFDAVWEGEPMESSALARMLETVHSPLGQAFESYLTENLRGLFR